MKPAMPERDPAEVMDRFELAALEEALDGPEDFVDATRPGSCCSCPGLTEETVFDWRDPAALSPEDVDMDCQVHYWTNEAHRQRLNRELEE